MSADDKLRFLLVRVRIHFRHINQDEGLTADDKKRLKEYYLEHFVTPQARKLLEKKLAEEAEREQRRKRRSAPSPRRTQ